MDLTLAALLGAIIVRPVVCGRVIVARPSESSPLSQMGCTQGIARRQLLYSEFPSSGGLLLRRCIGARSEGDTKAVRSSTAEMGQDAT